MKNLYRCFTKLKCFSDSEDCFILIPKKDGFFTMSLLTSKFNNNLERKTLLTILTTILSIKVNANPLIGPIPAKNNTKAAMAVVMLACIIM